MRARVSAGQKHIILIDVKGFRTEMGLNKEQLELLQYIQKMWSDLGRKQFLFRPKLNDIPSLLETMPQSVRSGSVEYLLTFIHWAYQNRHIT